MIIGLVVVVGRVVAAAMDGAAAVVVVVVVVAEGGVAVADGDNMEAPIVVSSIVPLAAEPVGSRNEGVVEYVS